MRALVLLATTLAIAFSAQAQPAATPPVSEKKPAEPQKLEAFQAKTGAVIIKGYSEVGVVGGNLGSVTIFAMEFTDASSGEKERGVVIEVKEAGRLEREDRAYIDYDEVDSLVAGIDYITKVNANVTKLGNFEATYRTRGDMSIVTFSSDRRISAAIRSGRVMGATAYVAMKDLQSFRQSILTAKQTLDAAK